jgi:L-ascorbate metabolism protein UlaG (beta-lactamase superfamily)
MSERPEMLHHLHWLGHASFRIDHPIVIYIDPWNVPPESPKADLILVSHEHYDHCSAPDVERLRREDTVVIANPAAAEALGSGVNVIRAGEKANAAGITIEAVPAYNLQKHFHPRQAGHVGFILTLAGERIYFAGDTDLIPEMEDLSCDVALLPVSGTYVMEAEEAARAAEVLQPRVAIPMHYGAGVVGTVDDARRFAELTSVPVEILQAEGAGGG